MKKTVTAMEARRNFGGILDAVSLKDDIYIINRAGKPVAAFVSISRLKKFEQSEDEAREEFYAWVDKMLEKSKGTRKQKKNK